MKTEITIPIPAELAELAIRFNAMPTAADRRRAAAAVCSVLEAIEGRAVTQEAEVISLGDTDAAIARVIREKGPVCAKEIAAICSAAGRWMSDQTVRDRMRSKLPLRRSGYRHDASRKGYVAPH